MIDTTTALLDQAKKTIDIEINGLISMKHRLDNDFTQACQTILACQGRVVVTGMGKSGHIGRKIAATLASTGTPAFFVHPGEANHGDIGMITSNDVVIAISNSGETPEILTILPLILRLGAPLIGLCGKPQSTLAQAAKHSLNTGADQEACPLGLAPTASTTCTLVMGDALATALLTARGFTADDFAHRHPGGSLGRRLLLKVDELMHKGSDLPLVNAGTRLSDALLEMTAKRFGMTGIVDKNGHLVGVYTDGDLRRTLEKKVVIREASIDEVMTRNCRIIEPGLFAAEALRIMEDHKITSLFVTDTTHTPLGIVHLHDLLSAGVA